MSEDITVVRNLPKAQRREKNRVIRALMLKVFPDTPPGECSSVLEWNTLKALKALNMTDLIHATTWWDSGADIQDITLCLTADTRPAPA